MKKKLFFCTVLLDLCIYSVFAQQSIDSYVLNPDSNTYVQVAGSTNALSSPVDLDFFKNQSSRPFELWILNQGTSGTGGSTVIVSNANKSSRTSKYIKDGNAWHFMSMASAIAFGDSFWATSADILDANHSTGRYTGPTLWPSDLKIYGIVGNPSTPSVNGSHLDMIHQSPYSKGIAFERDLVYWVLDGYEGTLKRYDFGQPHQPGGADHSAGRVRVYSDFKFTRHTTLPSHIVIDANKKYLYGCDPIGKRVFRVDITTGAKSGNATKVNSEALVEYVKYAGLSFEDVITTGLVSPVGIDIYADRLIVTDNATDEIIIYSVSEDFKEIGRLKLPYASPDPMGIKVGPDGKIYFVDKTNKRAYMIDNSAVMPLSVESISTIDSRINASPNPTSSKVTLRDAESQPAELIVSNIMGEIVLSQNTGNSDMMEIDFSDLASGQYFVRVISDKSVRTLRVVKQ